MSQPDLHALLIRCLSAVKAWQNEQAEYHDFSVDGWKLQADIEQALGALKEESSDGTNS